MSISLPSSPSPVALTPKLKRAGTDLPSPGNGLTQRINRIGDRFAFDVQMPPMERAEGEVWVNRLLTSFGSTIVMDYPQPYDGVGATGTPLINGAGQSGTTLNMDGLTAGYTFREGQIFSVYHAGHHYTLMSGGGTANGSGQIALPIWPMLRAPFADNAVVNVAQPKIEGLIGGDQGTWTLSGAQHVGLAFTITENR